MSASEDIISGLSPNAWDRASARRRARISAVIMSGLLDLARRRVQGGGDGAHLLRARWTRETQPQGELHILHRAQDLGRRLAALLGLRLGHAREDRLDRRLVAAQHAPALIGDGVELLAALARLDR